MRCLSNPKADLATLSLIWITLTLFLYHTKVDMDQTLDLSHCMAKLVYPKADLDHPTADLDNP